MQEEKIMDAFSEKNCISILLLSLPKKKSRQSYYRFYRVHNSHNNIIIAVVG